MECWVAGVVSSWRGVCRRIAVFFFQAEDGIRDLTVTGVQTCALPISVAGHASSTSLTFRASVSGTKGFCRNADRKSTRLNSSHSQISYAVFCLKKKKKTKHALFLTLNTHH